jgi:phage terminase large subunit
MTAKVRMAVQTLIGEHDRMVPWFNKFFKFLKFTSRNVPIVDLWGGAASGKSHAICQELVDRMFNETDIRIMVFRKTGPSLEITTFQMVLDILNNMGKVEGRDYHLNKSTKTIRVITNIMWFQSLDKQEKKKSLNINYTYLEEATEFSREDYLQIVLRVRRINLNGTNQIFLSHNPTDEYHWTKTDILDKADGINIITLHSTFKDNAYLPEMAKQQLLLMKDVDFAVYTVYALGKYAVITTRIYDNFVLARTEPGVKPIAFGLDFGYNNPTAMVSIVYHDEQIWVNERIFQKYLTTPQLIEKIKEVMLKEERGVPIYADPSRPDIIEEIQHAGLNIHPAKNEVKGGIDKVKRLKLNISENDINLLTEIRSYKWRETKNEQVLDEPVKINDHLMDAMRYAIYSSEIEVVKLPGEHTKRHYPVSPKTTMPSGIHFPDTPGSSGQKRLPSKL